MALEEWKLRLTSAKGEVEVEAELGNILPWATYLEHVSFDILDVIDILDIAFTLNNQGK